MFFPKNDKYFDYSKTYNDKLDNIFNLIPRFFIDFRNDDLLTIPASF